MAGLAAARRHRHDLVRRRGLRRRRTYERGEHRAHLRRLAGSHGAARAPLPERAARRGAHRRHRALHRGNHRHRGARRRGRAAPAGVQPRLKEALERNALRLPGELTALADPATRGPFFQDLRAQPWVVYAKRPFAGPQQVLDYLGHYTHRIALSNARLFAFDTHGVTFRWRDRAHGNRQKILTLPTEQFIGRFLLHVLPKGFVRIRHYGLSANRTKAKNLAAARAALDVPPTAALLSETVDAFVTRVLGIDLTRCARCHLGRLRLVAIDPPQPRPRSPPTDP